MEHGVDAVDSRRRVPIRITRAPVRLWEPGDATGMPAQAVTWTDDPPSTIHNPYYLH